MVGDHPVHRRAARAYHAYQGIGPIFGNFAMGVVFGWCYRRWGRVMPLVIAHT